MGMFFLLWLRGIRRARLISYKGCLHSDGAGLQVE
jgi:hypothetical protein